MRTTRRAFLRGSVATGSAVLSLLPDSGRRRRTWSFSAVALWCQLCPRTTTGRPPVRGDARRGKPDLHGLPRSATRSSLGCVISRAQRFGYETLRAAGIAVVHDRASSVDPQSRRRLHSGFSDGSGWRSRPWTRDRGRSPARRMSSVPYRPLRRGKSKGRWHPICRGRARVGRRTNSGCDLSMLSAWTPTPSCRPTIG